MEEWKPVKLIDMATKRDLQKIASCSKAEETDRLSSTMAASVLNILSSRKKIKQRSQLETKNKMAAKKPKYLKSKAKQVPDNSRKLGRKKRVKMDDLYDNLEAKFNVMERAGGLLATVATELPTFVKCMLPSNVAYGFWLFLPKKFCSLHLPSEDATIILVDECGNEYNTKYLLDRNGLSAGWRGFSLAHRLHKGDILVFHLIGPCKLKVHIVRVYGLAEYDAAYCLMNINTLGKRRSSENANAEKVEKTLVHKKAKKSAKSPSLEESQLQQHLHKNCKATKGTCLGLVMSVSENNNGSKSETANGIRMGRVCRKKFA